MSSNYKVLVVDDDLQILRVMEASLPLHGYDLKVVDNGQEALKVVEKHVLDLIILDLIMPGISGLDVCKTIRKTSNVPIIILSARQASNHVVSALELGADDYIRKPFSMNALLARMRVLLRRFNTKTENSILNVGSITINPNNLEVMIDGKHIKLTPTEFAMFKCLVSNVGKVITHQTLLEYVWASKSLEQRSYVRVCINQLRQKIEPNPENPKYILTVPWIGYKLCCTDNTI